MAQTTDTAKRSAGLPMEEPIMIRYSPHHEFPLSTVTSVGLHALVIGLLIIGGILVARLNWGGDVPPPPANAVAMEEPAGGGGGNPNGVGKGPGDGATEGAPDAPLPDPNEVLDVRPDSPREHLKEVRKDASQLPEFQDEEGKRLIEEGGKEVDKILRLNPEVRKKLKEGLAAGFGEGGSGRGGGRGTGIGPGQGGSVGPGSGNAEERVKRTMRWTILWNTRDGKDYIQQLMTFGAILAIPDNTAPDGFLVIRDLSQSPAQPKAEDIAKIHRIYWVGDEPQSVRTLFAALGLPPPPFYAVFFSPEFEEKLLQLELNYRGKKENEITETRFGVRRIQGTYEPYVLSQR
jgi:hypothetical protein